MRNEKMRPTIAGAISIRTPERAPALDRTVEGPQRHRPLSSLFHKQEWLIRRRLSLIGTAQPSIPSFIQCSLSRILLPLFGGLGTDKMKDGTMEISC